MPINRKIDGAWRSVVKRYRKINGEWREVKASYRKVGGQWRQTYVGAVHELYTSGLENFEGTYTVERREDGSFYCSLEGKVKSGTNAQIGFIIPDIPANSHVSYILDYEKWVTEQENEVLAEDSSRILYYYQTGYTNWQNDFMVNGFFRIYFNVDVSYTAIRTNFTVKNLKINGVDV